MKIKFLGPAGSDTGYCAVLRTASGDRKFLVDCGAASLEGTLGINGSCGLDFVVLTGPQLDRCRSLPRLTAAGFDGPIYCTRFAADLARINLRQAATTSDTHFNSTDVDKLNFVCLDDRPDFQFGTPVDIGHELTLSFQLTGTAGGACNVILGWRSSDGDWDDIAFLGDQASRVAAGDARAMLLAQPLLNRWASYVVANTTFNAKPDAANEDRRTGRLAKWAKALSDAAARGGATVVCLTQPDQLPEVLLDLHVVLEGDLHLPGRHNVGQSSASSISVIVGADFADQVSAAYGRALCSYRCDGQQSRLYRNPELKELLGCRTESELDDVLRCIFPEQVPSVTQFRHYTLLYEGTAQWCLPPTGDRFEVLIVSAGAASLANLGQERLAQGLRCPAATVLLTDPTEHNPVARRLRAASQSAGTNGGGPIALGNVELPLASLKAKIDDIGDSYATQSNRNELVEHILKRQATLPDHKPSCRVFINHTDTIRSRSLAWFINERSRPQNGTECIIEGIEIPNGHSGWFDLDLDRWAPDESPRIDEAMGSVLRRILAQQQRTNDLLAELLG